MTRRATHAERAASERAREATSGAVEVARQPSPGRRLVAGTSALIDRAEQLNNLAQQPSSPAAQQPSSPAHREYGDVRVRPVFHGYGDGQGLMP
ncbi:UNVERIFIED_CONTAM: hypothetical protein RKD43_006758 [Streptomyces graminofaciens]